jgi:hypothetical protein
LFDDDGNELRNEVLMIKHGKRILYCCDAYIGVKSGTFKVGSKREGGPFLDPPPVSKLAT